MSSGPVLCPPTILTATTHKTIQKAATPTVIFGEQVAGLGAEGALPAHAAEGAGQPAPFAALDQHQDDQEDRR